MGRCAIAVGSMQLREEMLLHSSSWLRTLEAEPEIIAMTLRVQQVCT